MNRAMFITVLFSLTALGASAQTLRFKNGRTAELSKVRIANNQISLPADAANPAAGEIVFPLSDLERVEWPTPKELVESADALKSGKLAEALKKNDTILSTVAPFRDIPGTWWPRVMLVRTEILARLGRDADAEVACEQLQRSALGAPLADQARIAVIDALAASSANRDIARKRLEAFSASASGDKAIAARIDLVRGRLLQSEGKIEDALLTYLRIPVLYPAQTDPAPAALLGAATCLRALGENVRADTALRTVIERFPDSSEAAAARSLLPTF